MLLIKFIFSLQSCTLAVSFTQYQPYHPNTFLQTAKRVGGLCSPHVSLFLNSNNYTVTKMRKEYTETGGINMYVIKHKTNKYVN